MMTRERLLVELLIILTLVAVWWVWYLTCAAPVAPSEPARPPTPTIEASEELPPLVSSHGEWMTVVALLTAYTDHDADAPTGRDGKPLRLTSTQTDTVATPYGVAADPKLIPYGTQVMLDEYMAVSYPDKAWEVDDTGGKMRQNNRRYFIVHLDLRYRTRGSALKRGKEWAEIHVNVAGWTDAQKQRLRTAAMNGERMRSEGMKP